MLAEMRAIRLATRFALCLTLAHAGCSSFAERDECLDRPESLAYVAKLRQSIDREWERPKGVGRGQVFLSARVNRDGELRSVSIEVRTEPDRRCEASARCRIVGEPLARSMQEAIRHAEPVGPPSEQARCMLSRTVVLTFQSSDRYVPDPEE